MTRCYECGCRGHDAPKIEKKSTAVLKAEVQSSLRFLRLLRLSTVAVVTLFVVGLAYGVGGSMLGLAVNSSAVAGLTVPFGVLGFAGMITLFCVYNDTDWFAELAEKKELIDTRKQVEVEKILREHGLSERA